MRWMVVLDVKAEKDADLQNVMTIVFHKTHDFRAKFNEQKKKLSNVAVLKEQKRNGNIKSY